MSETSPPEFSRLVDPRQILEAPVELVATPEERAALTRRFALVSIGRLETRIALIADGEAVNASGRFSADIVQSCAVSGEDLPVAIDEPITLRFVPQRPIAAEEIELAAEELDEIEYAGSMFDLGEAVAQSLALAIDPYAIGPKAARARKAAGITDEAASGPFAALAALKKT